MSSDPRSQAAELCANARVALQAGAIDQAIALATQAVAADPSSADSHEVLGVAYARKGAFDVAIRAFSSAVRIDANRVNARMNLAAALQRKGLVPQAVAQLQEVLRIDPNNARAIQSLHTLGGATAAPAPNQPVSQPDFRPAFVDLGGGVVPGGPAQPNSAYQPQQQAYQPQPLAGPPPSVNQSAPQASSQPQGSGYPQAAYQQNAYQSTGYQLPSQYAAPQTYGQYAYAPSVSAPPQGEDAGGWSFENVMGVLSSPKAFFASQRGCQGIGGPMLFLVVNQVILFLVGFLVSLARVPSPNTGMMSSTASLGTGFAFFVGLFVGLPVAVILGVVASLIVAGVVHLFVMAFGGRQGYDATFRAITYAGAAFLTYVVAIGFPLLGIVGALLSLVIELVGLVWFVVLACIGVCELHDISMGAAIGGVLVGLGLVFALVMVLVFALVATVASLNGLHGFPRMPGYYGNQGGYGTPNGGSFPSSFDSPGSYGPPGM